MMNHLSLLSVAVALTLIGCVDDATDDDTTASYRAQTYQITQVTVSGGPDDYAVCYADQMDTYNGCMRGNTCAAWGEYCNEEFNYNIWVNCVLDPGTPVEPLNVPVPTCP